jgi:hypothetical protein
MTTAEQGVRAAMQLYFDGTNEGDTAKVRSAFHPQAAMTGYLQGNLMAGSAAPFFDVVANVPAPVKSGVPVVSEITRIDIAGPIAAVTVVEGPYLGLHFTEYFHLIEVDGRWQIVSKTFMHR